MASVSQQHMDAPDASESIEAAWKSLINATDEPLQRESIKKIWSCCIANAATRIELLANESHRLSCSRYPDHCRTMDRLDHQ